MDIGTLQSRYQHNICFYVPCKTVENGRRIVSGCRGIWIYGKRQKQLNRACNGSQGITDIIGRFRDV